MRVIFKPERMGGLRAAVAVLCALLIIFTGMVQVAHAHSGSAATHADCSLCVAAHMAVHLTQNPAPAVLVRMVTRAEVARVCAGSDAFSTFALFTRPPPVQVAAA